LKELIVRDRDAVIARRNVPATFWRRADLGSLRTVRIGPQGDILVQTERGLVSLDSYGKEREGIHPIAGREALEGEVVLRDGRTLGVFNQAYPWPMDLDHDLDGDGRQEIVQLMDGVLAYSQEGEVVLDLVVPDLWGSHVALGNLDGEPGDEVVLFVPEYGLVAFGLGAAEEEGSVHARTRWED
jgi:hypothetical protein